MRCRFCFPCKSVSTASRGFLIRRSRAHGTRRFGVLKPGELSCVVNESGRAFGRNRSQAISPALYPIDQLRTGYAEQPRRRGKITPCPRNRAFQQQRFNIIQRRRIIVFADAEKQVGHLFCHPVDLAFFEAASAGIEVLGDRERAVPAQAEHPGFHLLAAREQHSRRW